MTAHAPELALDIVVYGSPEPAGSKTADPAMRRGPSGPQPVIGKGGRPVFRMRDANPRSYAWKDQVAKEAALARAGHPLLEGPVAIEFVFYRPRNRGDFGTGRNAHLVKDSAPAFPTVAPDALKLARAVEDALSGVLYVDDAQIVDESIKKRFGEPARVEIRAWPMAEQRAADLPMAERVKAGSRLAPYEADPEQQQLIAV